MPDPDITRDILTILRDSFQPRVTQLLAQATEDDIDTLKDREILEQEDSIDTLNLNDPIQILNVLQNLRTHRSILFTAVADDFVLDRIATVRRLRNGWAHFAPQPTERSTNAVRWLLEKSNDQAACERFDALAAAPRQAQRSKHAADVDAEVNRRAGKVAEDEQRLRHQQVRLEQHEGALAEREAKLKQREVELDSQLQVGARERENLKRRRDALAHREQALERAPAPENLTRRERDVAAEEVVVSQLRQDYEALLGDVRLRSAELHAQQQDAQQRSEQLDVRQSELDDLRTEAAALSTRLGQSVERLEELERRQRQVLLTGESSSKRATGIAPEKQQEDRQHARSGSEQRPCRRTGCEGSLEKKSGKFGEFFGCTRYPSCRYTEEVPNDPTAAQRQYGLCPDCESPLVRRQSFRGPFLGCSNYPRCRHTQNLPSGPDKPAKPDPPAQQGRNR